MAKKEPIVIKHKGALTAKAKAAGQSIDAYAKGHVHSKGLTGVQSRLYENVLKPHWSGK